MDSALSHAIKEGLGTAIVMLQDEFDSFEFSLSFDRALKSSVTQNTHLFALNYVKPHTLADVMQRPSSYNIKDGYKYKDDRSCELIKTCSLRFYQINPS